MKPNEVFENIFSGTKVTIISATQDSVVYKRSPVYAKSSDWPYLEERIDSFVKPRQVFWQTYKPVDNLST